MSVQRTAILSVLSILSSGCVTSLAPVYFGADLEYQPDILGEWISPDEQSTFQITESRGYAYKIVAREKGDESQLVAHCFHIGEGTFVDLTPAVTLSSDLAALGTTTHWIVRLDQLSPDTLTLSFVNDARFRKILSEATPPLAHVCGFGKVTITAPPQAIREFIDDHRQELFDSPKNSITLVRRP